MEWTEFELAMTDPRYQHGAPVYKDEPRMTVQAVADNLESGKSPERIAEAYQIDLRLVLGTKRFLESQPVASRSLR